MKYKKAEDILPDKLLKELQKYISGETLYIPSAKSKKSWGEASGARTYYLERNEKITADFKSGVGIIELSEKYGLSEESIKKIIYKASERSK